MSGGKNMIAEELTKPDGDLTYTAIGKGAKMSEPIFTGQLVFDKETKNKVRYKEKGDVPMLGTIYIPKFSLPKDSIPLVIAVVISEV